MKQEISYRPVNYSRITMTELMVPSYANFGGKIHGGILLALMDKVAYACAAKHAGGYCVTVSVDDVNFLEPVEVGELVSLHASVNFVGNSSLVVGIRVTSEDVVDGSVRHTNTSYFTMVAKDESGKPRQVPGLLLETRDDVRRCIESVKRIDLKGRYRHELDNAKTNVSVEQEMNLLHGKRIRVSEETGITF